jgi:hypothetical protein
MKHAMGVANTCKISGLGLKKDNEENYSTSLESIRYILVLALENTSGTVLTHGYRKYVTELKLLQILYVQTTDSSVQKRKTLFSSLGEKLI